MVSLRNLNLEPLRLAVALRCVIENTHVLLNNYQESTLIFSASMVSPPESYIKNLSLSRSILSYFPVKLVSVATRAIFPKLQPLGIVPSILGSRICSFPAFSTGKMNNNSSFAFLSHVYSIMRLKVPAPTVLPPSRIAKRNPFSSATG